MILNSSRFDWKNHVLDQDRTDRSAPSFFADVQLPKGINVKFKYYPSNFLNRSYVGKDFGIPVNYADYSKTNLFYVGLSYNYNPKEMGEKLGTDHKREKLANFEEYEN